MKRRIFIERMAIAAMGILTRPVVQAAAGRGLRVVDTHTHFYDPTRPQGVPWPGKGTPLDRRVLPPAWAAVASPVGVTETVVVEASPWLDDNVWILELAAREKSIVGFVGNLPPHDPDF